MSRRFRLRVITAGNGLPAVGLCIRILILLVLLGLVLPRLVNVIAGYGVTLPEPAVARMSAGQSQIEELVALCRIEVFVVCPPGGEETPDPVGLQGV